MLKATTFGGTKFRLLDEQAKRLEKGDTEGFLDICWLSECLDELQISGFFEEKQIEETKQAYRDFCGFVGELEYQVNCPELFMESSKRREQIYNARIQRYNATYGTPDLEGELDIVRAKEYPIENLIDFNRGFAKCIWHQDNTPSLKLYSNNTVHCFGCGKSGDAIDVARQLYSTPFRETVKGLCS